MERPLAVIGFTYLSALMAALFFGAGYCKYITVFFLAAFIVSLIIKPLRKRTVIPVAFITSAVAFFSFGIYSYVNVLPTSELDGKTAEVKASLCDIPYEQNGRCYYKLETEKIDYQNSPQKIKILVSSKNAYDIQVYDKIEAKIRFYKNTDKSYSEYNISKGIMLCGNIDSYSKVSVKHTNSKPIYYYALSTRQYVTDIIKKLLPEKQSSFVCALILGDKTGLSSDVKDNFKSAGISHIVAVSGFHISVVTQIFYIFLYYFTRRRKRISSLVCTVFVFAFMAVTGFSPSVVRAGIMQIIYLVGKGILRQSDSLNSLGFASLVICFLNPYAVADVGFLLSCSATLGIIICYKKATVYINEFFSKKKTDVSKLHKKVYNVTVHLIKAFASVITVTISATICTLPITVIYFKQFALYSVVSNLLISFAASMLIFSSVIMILLYISCIFSFLTVPFIIISGVLTDYILWVAEKISSLPFSAIITSQSFIPLWLSLVILLGAFVFILKNRKNAVKYFALVVTVSFFVGEISGIMVQNGSVKLSVLDVGKGFSVILCKNGETAILSCGGETGHQSVINDYLSGSAVKNIDYMLLMSNNDENSAYAEKLLSRYNVLNIQVYDENKYYERIYSQILNTQSQIFSENKSVNTVHWKNISVLTYKDDNNTAVYFKINNIKFLMCGEDTDCSKIPKEWLKADFVITDGKLLNAEALSAEYIIISDNNDSLSDDIPPFAKMCRHIFATGGKGNISMRLFKDNTVSIRRENEWLN